MESVGAVKDAVEVYQELTKEQQIQFMINIHCPGLHPLEWMSITTTILRPEFWKRYNIIRCRFKEFDFGLKGVRLSRKPNDVDKKPIIRAIIMTGFYITNLVITIGANEKPTPFIMGMHYIQFDNYWKDIEEWLEEP